MGNIGHFYAFYRNAFFLLTGISMLLFIVILYFYFRVEQQQDTIYELKKELIEYQSREKADQIIQEWASHVYTVR